MTDLVVTANADADFEGILGYLEREAGVRVAESYGRKIGECLVRLVEFPGIGTRRPALGTDTRIGIVRPYILIYDYAAATDTLTLLRIVHGRRNITARLIRQR
jgi:plasmid stabilization system protein ParE